VILAWFLCFSLVVRPVIALCSGIMIFLLGEWLGDMVFFAEKSKDAMFINAVKVLHWISPNLYKMNWKSYYFLENGIPWDHFVWMLAHMVGWILVLILLTNFFFRRKDIV
jgi:ABC-type transport system involved in multi-copper enzyme maturation permease subunit